MTTTLRLLTLALLTSSLFGLTDCKKSSDPDPKKPSEREMWLTSPGWKLKSFAIEETTAGGVVTTNNVPLTSFDPCSLDDLEYYHADKSFIVDEGLVKCSATYPQFLTSGTWAFASGETEIVVNPSQPGAKPKHIRTLTATGLTLADPSQSSSNGTTSVQIRTYSAR